MRTESFEADVRRLVTATGMVLGMANRQAAVLAVRRLDPIGAALLGEVVHLIDHFAGTRLVDPGSRIGSRQARSNFPGKPVSGLGDDLRRARNFNKVSGVTLGMGDHRGFAG